MTAARILDVSEEEYHRDPCEVPSLSSSIAKILVQKSPLHAHAAHPRLGGRPRRPTKALDRGSLIHLLVLGEGGAVEIVDADSWRSKAAKEAREAARARGALPVLERDYEAAVAAAETISARLAGRGISFDGGQTELSVAWTEEATHGPVQCRGRFDWVDLDAGLIRDLKSARSADPEKVARSVVDYGYHIQRAAYVRAASALRPELTGRVRFELVFAEHERPHDVLVCRLAGVLRELGERKWGEAVERWSWCVSADRWPGRNEETIYLQAPPWVLREEEEGE